MSSEGGVDGGIRSDVVEEALRVAAAAEGEGVALRLLGGVAIKIRAENGLHPAFRREYADHDFIAGKGASNATQKLFQSLGYVPHTRFNAINGRERLLFFDEGRGRQVDVFVGSFRMSHEIPFGKRLTLEPTTIPLAELLVTKLQIVELNEKDVRDALALFYDHPVEETDGKAINGARVAELCAADWGLWRTFTANLASLPDYFGRYELPEGGEERISDRVERLRGRIEEEPKPLKWRMRARVGDRKRWYELPEEVEGGP